MDKANQKAEQTHMSNQAKAGGASGAGAAAERKPARAATDHLQLDVFQIEASDLPKLLQLGLPPAMARQQATTFWGTHKAAISAVDPQVLRAYGLATDRFQQSVVEGYDMISEDLLQHRLGAEDLCQYDARRAFQALRGQHMTSHIKAPKACTMTAPKDINVYTDGSLQTPGNHLYSLGGAGVWWPARADQTISDAEADITILDKDHHQGLRLLANLTGYGGSSTRMELAASIIAISADDPAHVGTDSKAFCEKAQYVHQLANERRGPRRPWSLHTDGDLWHIYHQHVVAKGTQAIRITKVKGHATGAMVTAGQVRPQDKEGNDQADAAADEGVREHGLAIQQYG